MDTQENLRIGLIGCGVIGHKRAKSIALGASLAICCDVELSKAQALADRNPGALASTDWRSVISSDGIDAVLVCTTHDVLAGIAEAAASNGKHVLIEKPGACRATDLDKVSDAASKTGVRVRVGFNHRYHRAIQKARQIFDSGVLSDLMYVRARYGHGGRAGYEQEWRSVPEISGGGEAIDQGMHLLDLARWFLGELQFIGGRAPTYFWNMPVEDNAFLLLETGAGQVAFLHSSWTEWKNLFSFEICGRMGKLDIKGLGGSYGTERLAHYQMLPEMGPPSTTIYEYPMPDNSLNLEFAEFMKDIRWGRLPQPGIADAQAALRIIEQLYNGSRDHH